MAIQVWAAWEPPPWPRHSLANGYTSHRHGSGHAPLALSNGGIGHDAGKTLLDAIAGAILTHTFVDNKADDLADEEMEITTHYRQSCRPHMVLLPSLWTHNLLFTPLRR